MSESSANKVKIRFKFRSGEEFEAEGNPDFIEKQRSDFLQLIGKDELPSTYRRTRPVQMPAPAPVLEDTPTVASSAAQPSDPQLGEIPAIYRRSAEQHPSIPSITWLKDGGISRSISAAEARQGRRNVSSDADIRLWEQLVRTDDRLVYLRRKSRQLSADTAALLLIAAAKVLLRDTEGYSALLLSKALKKSGYGGERLDRALAGEMRQGTIRCEGTKRSRIYLLSNEGFARAYVLATKLAQEWQ